MPPAPGVDRLEIEILEISDKLVRARVSPTLNKWGRDIISKYRRAGRMNELFHRSRKAAIAWGPLRVAEFDHRLEKLDANKAWLAKTRMPARHTITYNSGFVRATLDALKLDMGYIRTYVKEHERSSVMPGVKWSNLGLDKSAWDGMLDAIRGVLELHEHNAVMTYKDRPHYAGLRARGEKLEGQVGYATETELTRCRITLYYPSDSVWAAFIPDKLAWYKKVFALVDEIGDDMRLPRIQWTSGATHGGKIFLHARDHFDEHRHFSALDGGSWESVVGNGFSPGCSWQFLPVGGYLHLPSGSMPTTAHDTAYMLYIARLMAAREGGDASFVIQGDDLNVWHDRGHWKGSELVERQDLDTELKFLLGISYSPDLDRPHILGFKYSGDRAAKAVNLRVGKQFTGSNALESDLSEREKKMWHGLYFGEFGSRTLLDAIRRVKPERYRGGAEELVMLLEELEASQTPRESDDD